MLSDRDLHELLEYNPQTPVISLYLKTDLTDGSIDTYKLNMRNLLKDVEQKKDADIIERYIEHEYDWSGRSVAVFSCSSKSWLRAYPIAVPLRSRVRIDNKPHVKPLADLWDAYGGYGVVLVDKQSARVFYFHLGELREEEDIWGESIRRTKRGGGSQAAGRRGGSAGQTDYVDEASERNIREAAVFATKFFSENKVRRVLIGGTEDNIALFRNHLPKSWQSLVVGTFPVSMTASHNTVLQRAMQVGQDAERRQETRLVESIITGAEKGKNGVVGLDGTLSAAHEGRVQVLVFREGFRSPGHQCQVCGYLTVQDLQVCPFCGGEVKELADAVEQAVRKVLQSGGDVEVLHEEGKLAQYGHIGGLLRY